MAAPDDNTANRAAPFSGRHGGVILVMLGVAAAVVVGLVSGAISLPGFGNGSQAQASSAAALAAQRQAANRQWAATTCTDILDWKNEIHRDGTSLDPGFGPSARVEDAIGATGRLLNGLDKLGLPPAARNPRARAEIERLRSDIETRVHGIEHSASSAASGNLLALGAVIGDLANDGAIGTQLANEVRHVVSLDLGLSLVETRACRQLVGIPV